MMKQDQIPNKALNGEEILMLAVKDFEAMLRRDCMFGRGIAYRRASYSLSATFHLGHPHPTMELKSRTKPNGVIEGEVPLKIDPLCGCGHERDGLHRMGEGEDHSCFGMQLTEKDQVMVRCACMKYHEAAEQPETIVVALERDAVNDNPNLARVHHDLPIRVQERMPPRALMVDNVVPGEPPIQATDPFPEFRNTEIRYDKTQYPEGAPPVDRDVSEATAGKLGVKSGMGLRERKK